MNIHDCSLFDPFFELYLWFVHFSLSTLYLNTFKNRILYRSEKSPTQQIKYDAKSILSSACMENCLYTGQKIKYSMFYILIKK